MDEQDPRITADRMRGLGDDETVGREKAYRGTSTTSAAARDEQSVQKTREIRADIAQTREEMSETVNAIQERLRPGNLASDAANQLKAATMEKASDLADSEPVQYARANPIPAVMVGIGAVGLAWLAAAGRPARSRDYAYNRSRDWRYTPRYAAETNDYTRAGGYQSAADYNPDLSTAARGYTASHLDQGRFTGLQSRTNRPYMQRGSTIGVQDRLIRTWDDNPVLIGAAALVAGAIVGLSIPETDPENRLMGQTRDDLIDTVQETVRDKVTEVQDAATNAVGQVQQIAKAAVGLGEDPQR